MPNNDDLQVLYQKASKNLNVGTYENFVKNIQDPVKRKSFYGAASKHLNLHDYDSFSSHIDRLTAPQSQSAVQKVQEADPEKLSAAVSNVFNEYPALKSVSSPNDYLVQPASGEMLNALREHNAGLEFQRKGETDYQWGSTKMKLDNADKNRIYLNMSKLKPDQIQDAIKLDMISHGMHGNSEYDAFVADLDKRLRAKYGNKMVDNNGGADAYVRGYLSNSPEYKPYKDETKFLPSDYFKQLDNILKKEPTVLTDDFGLSKYIDKVKSQPSPVNVTAPADQQPYLPSHRLAAGYQKVFGEELKGDQQADIVRSMHFPDTVPIDPAIIANLSPEKQAQLQKDARSNDQAFVNTSTILQDALDRLKKNPNDVDAHTNMGYLYYQSKQYSGAVSAYQNALQVDPTNTDALIGLGNVASVQGDHSSALAYYKEASDTFNKHGIVDPKSLASIAVELNRGGKNDLALKFVTKALDADPKSQELHALKYAIDTDLGNTEDAKQDYYNYKVTLPSFDMGSAPNVEADNLAAAAITENAMKDLGNSIRGTFTGNPRSPFAFLNPMSVAQGLVRGGYHLGKDATKIADAIVPDYGGYKGVDTPELAQGIVGSMKDLTDIGFSALTAVNPELYAFNTGMGAAGAVAPNVSSALFNPITLYLKGVYGEMPMPKWVESSAGMSDVLGNLLLFHAFNSTSKKEKLDYQQIAMKFLKGEKLSGKGGAGTGSYILVRHPELGTMAKAVNRKIDVRTETDFRKGTNVTSETDNPESVINNGDGTATYKGKKYNIIQPLSGSDLMKVNQMLRMHIDKYMPAMASIVKQMPDVLTAEQKVKILPITIEMDALGRRRAAIEDQLNQDYRGIFKDFYQEELSNITKRDAELRGQLKDIYNLKGELESGKSAETPGEVAPAPVDEVPPMTPMESAVINIVPEDQMTHEAQEELDKLKEELGIKPEVKDVSKNPETIDTKSQRVEGVDISTDAPRQFITHAGNEYEVTKDADGFVQFENSQSGKPITRKSEHYDDVVAKYITQNFADAPQTEPKEPINSTEDWARLVASESKNPLEILMTAAHIDEMEGGTQRSGGKDAFLGSGEVHIAFNDADVQREFGHNVAQLPNWEAIRTNYYSPNGKSIDQSHQEANMNFQDNWEHRSDESITKEDIWDFIKKYPNGYDESTMMGPLTKQLGDRFEAITGAPFDRQMMDKFRTTMDAANKLPDSDADIINAFVEKNPGATTGDLFASEEGKLLSPESKSIIEDETKLKAEDDPWADVGTKESKGSDVATPVEKKQPAAKGKKSKEVKSTEQQSPANETKTKETASKVEKGSPKNEPATKTEGKPKSELDDALSDFMGAWDEIKNEAKNAGIIDDPIRKAEQDLKLLAAAMKLLRASIKEGIHKFEDIVKFISDRIGDKIHDILPMLKRAYASLHGDAEMSEADLDKLDDVKTVRNFEIKPSVNEEKSAGPVDRGDISNTDAGSTDVSQLPGGKQPDLFDQPVPKQKAKGGGGGKGGTSTPGKKTNDEIGNGGTGSGGGNKLDDIGPDGSKRKQSDDDSERTDGGNTKPARSTLKPEERNFIITPETTIVPAGGEMTKIRANIAAIKLLRDLQASGQLATPEEKKILAQFTGWGGLSSVLSVGKAGAQSASSWKAKYGALHAEIKSLLSTDEFNSAVNSTINAHYTSRPIINVMWDIASRFGFTGGKILEPSSGVGHIIGLMPDGLIDKATVTMIEMDTITGEIARLLYPENNVQVVGFQDAKIRPASQDMVIANVPFAASAPFDKAYPDLTKFSLHDYFIAKSMRMVKPGGIGIIITSSSTMDKPGSKFRTFLDQKENVDFLGAVRMPNSAFAANAGTEVTTDMIFLRKRDDSGRISQHAQKWNAVDTVREARTKEDKPFNIAINEYYLAHPEMMLGTMHLAHEVGSGGLYGPNNQTLAAPQGSTPESMVDMLKQRVESLPEKVFGTEHVPIESNPAMFAEAGDVEGTYAVDKDGKAYFIEDGERNALDFQNDKIEFGKGKTVRAGAVIRDFVTVKDFAKDLMKAEVSVDATDDQIEAKRTKLRSAYTTFTDRYGKLTGNKKIIFLQDDGESSMVYGLERIETEFITTKNGQIRGVGKVYRAKILTERVNHPYIVPTSAENVDDAVDLSMIYHGTIDVDYVASLLNTSLDQARKEILEKGLAYEDPQNGMLTSKEEYLSGNVREKLRIAEEASKEDKRFIPNVSALNAAQPPYIPMRYITPSLGAGWIPTNIYEQFASEVLESGVEVKYTPELKKNNYAIQEKGRQKSQKADTVWGIHGYSGVDLMAVAMNNRELAIYDKDPFDSKKRVKNVQATEEALNKLDDLKAEYIAWVKRSEALHGGLEDIFNRKVNNYTEYHSVRTIERFPGQAEYINGEKYGMRAHQSNAVFRCLRMSTLLAHQVGAGKTDVLITAAMEMRRLKTANKPMIAVWNETLEQFAARARVLYPAAKILAPMKASDMDAKNRQRLIASIAYGNWDIIIIPHSFLKFIPNDPQREIDFINERISALMDLKDGAEKYQQKDIEREIENAREQIAELKVRKVKDTAKAQLGIEKRVKKQLSARRDQTFYFEQLGVDALMLDEADAFKKIGFESARRNVRGVDTAGSQRALDAYLKAQYVMENNSGRNFIHATGTPISNTIAELWTMMRYSAPEVLEDLSITNFDAFAQAFANTETSVEMTAAGTVKEITRLKTFNNLPALVAAFRNHTDVVLSSDIAEFKKDNTLPKLKTGKAIPMIVEMSPAVKAVMNDIKSIYLWWEELKGAEKKALRHLPLVLYGQAKKAAVDVRLLNDRSKETHHEDDPDSKLNQLVKEAFQIYKDNTDMLGVQMIYCDSINSPDKTFNSHREIKNKLMALGVPEHEIIIANNKWKGSVRMKSMEDGCKGLVRFYIGHTDRLGVGVNVQTRIVAMHHLDAPPRPRDYDQRNGRGLRQGNLCAIPKSLGGFEREIGIYNWGVKNTLDALAYDRLAIKSFFTNQIITGKIGWGDIEDPSEDFSTSDMEHGSMMGLLSGSKTVLELNEAKRTVRKLEATENNYELKVKNLATRKRELEKIIPFNENEKKPLLESATEDIKSFTTDGKITRFSINGVEHIEGLGKSLDDAVSQAEVKARELLASEIRPVTIDVDFGKSISVRVEVYLMKIRDMHDARAFNSAIGSSVIRKAFKFDDKILGRSAWTETYHSAQSVINTAYSIIKDIQFQAGEIDSKIADQKSELEGVVRDLKEPFKFGPQLSEARTKVRDLTEIQKSESAAAPVIALSESAQTLVDAMKSQLEEASENADKEPEKKKPADDDEEDDDLGDDDDTPPPGGGSGDGSFRDREQRWQKKINDFEEWLHNSHFFRDRTGGAFKSGVPSDKILKTLFKILRTSVKAGFSLAEALRHAFRYLQTTDWYKATEKAGDKFDIPEFKGLLQSYGIDVTTDPGMLDTYIKRMRKYVNNAPDGEFEPVLNNLVNYITDRVKQIGDSDTRLMLDALSEIRKSQNNPAKLATAIKNFEKDMDAFIYRDLYRDATSMKRQAKVNLGRLQKFPDLRVVGMELANMPIVKNRKRVPPNLLFNYVRAIEPLNSRSSELLPDLNAIHDSINEMTEWAASIAEPEEIERTPSATDEERKRQQMEQWRDDIDAMKEVFRPDMIVRSPEIDTELQHLVKQFTDIDHRELDHAALKGYYGVMYNLANNLLVSPNLYNKFVRPVRVKQNAVSVSSMAKETGVYFKNILSLQKQLRNNPKTLWDAKLLRPDPSLRYDAPFWNNYIQRLTNAIEKWRIDNAAVEGHLEKLYQALSKNTFLSFEDMRERGRLSAQVRMWAFANQFDSARPDIDFRQKVLDSLQNMATSPLYTDLHADYMKAYNGLQFEQSTEEGKPDLIDLDRTYQSFTPAQKAYADAISKLINDRLQHIVQYQQMYIRGENVKMIKNYHPMEVLGGADIEEARTEQVVDALLDETGMRGGFVSTKAGSMFARKYPRKAFYSFSHSAMLGSFEGTLFDKHLTEAVKEVFGAMGSTDFTNAFTSDLAANMRTQLMTMLKHEIGFNEQAKSIEQRMIDSLIRALTGRALVSVKRFAEYVPNWMTALPLLADNPKESVELWYNNGKDFFSHPKEWLALMRDNGFSIYQRFSTHAELVDNPMGDGTSAIIINPFMEPLKFMRQSSTVRKKYDRRNRTNASKISDDVLHILQNNSLSRVGSLIQHLSIGIGDYPSSFPIWLSAFKKHLKEHGYETFDILNHPDVPSDAITAAGNYAENVIDRSVGTSNRGRGSEKTFAFTSEDERKNWLAYAWGRFTYFLGHLMYQQTMYTRHYVKTMITGQGEYGRLRATGSMAGLLAGNLAFGVIAKLLAAGVVGFGDEKEKEKQLRQIATGEFWLRNLASSIIQLGFLGKLPYFGKIIFSALTEMGNKAFTEQVLDHPYNAYSDALLYSPKMPLPSEYAQSKQVYNTFLPFMNPIENVYNPFLEAWDMTANGNPTDDDLVKFHLMRGALALANLQINVPFINKEVDQILGFKGMAVKPSEYDMARDDAKAAADQKQDAQKIYERDFSGMPEQDAIHEVDSLIQEAPTAEQALMYRQVKKEITKPDSEGMTKHDKFIMKLHEGAKKNVIRNELQTKNSQEVKDRLEYYHKMGVVNKNIYQDLIDELYNSRNVDKLSKGDLTEYLYRQSQRKSK